VSSPGAPADFSNMFMFTQNMMIKQQILSLEFEKARLDTEVKQYAAAQPFIKATDLASRKMVESAILQLNELMNRIELNLMILKGQMGTNTNIAEITKSITAPA
jgi:hypothetical protein